MAAMPLKRKFLEHKGVLMSTVIDTCGLSCPQPVLMFLNAIKGGENGPLEVLVDNDASLENITRAGKNRGFSVSREDAGSGIIRLKMVKNA